MKYFYVGATPETDREVVAAIAGRMGEEFGAPVRRIDLPAVEFAYDSRRKQYSSAEVLQMLALNTPGDAWKLLGVTERDLFIPVLTFVYGQAQLDGRLAAVSLARLRQEFYGLPPDREVLLHRALKEALHESGHLFGLVHCADRSCAMSLSTGIRQIDGKNAGFCAACADRFLRRPRES